MLSFQAWRYSTEELMESAPCVRALRRRLSPSGDENVQG